MSLINPLRTTKCRHVTQWSLELHKKHLFHFFQKIRSIHIMMTVAGSNLKSHNYIELPPEKS